MQLQSFAMIKKGLGLQKTTDLMPTYFDKMEEEYNKPGCQVSKLIACLHVQNSSEKASGSSRDLICRVAKAAVRRSG